MSESLLCHLLRVGPLTLNFNCLIYIMGAIKEFIHMNYLNCRGLRVTFIINRIIIIGVSLIGVSEHFGVYLWQQIIHSFNKHFLDL